jgi:hypothetical protein
MMSARGASAPEAIARVDDVKREWLPAVTSISLALNSLLFAFLVRRRFHSEAWVREAHVVHLYAVSAAMSPIILLVAMACRGLGL